MERRSPVAHLVARWRLNLDHIGAMIGEDLRAVRSAENPREVDHAQSAHRAGGRRGTHGSNFRSKGKSIGMAERRFPELAMFGPPSNAFSRVGVCRGRPRGAYRRAFSSEAKRLNKNREPRP